jgi:hypothetical protein
MMAGFLNSQMAAEEAEQARIEEVARMRGELKAAQMRNGALEMLLMKYAEIIVSLELELADARLKVKA